MSQKISFIFLILLVISFSAGIFTEITITPAGAVSSLLPAMVSGILNYIKNDIVTVAAAMIFSASVLLLPFVPLMVIGKVFSLGFSSAYILSSSSEKALGIIMAALLPRGIFKLPAYIALTLISIDMAIFIRNHYQNPQALLHGAPKHLLRFLFCFLALAASSILEVFLLKGVL